MRVLGVDPSLTATGLCWLAEGEAPSVHTAKTRPGQAGTMPKLGRMWAQTTAVMDAAGRADLVVVEAPSFGSKGSATRDLAGLWWLLIAELRAAECPLGIVPPAVLKKWTTGNGNADKFAVGQAIARRWPDVLLRNPDEADALALASIGLHHLGSLPWRATAVQEEQLTRVEWVNPNEEEEEPARV